MKNALEILAVFVCVGVVMMATAYALWNFIPWKEKSLYQQCLDDGLKEYECYALIYGGGRY